MKSVDLYIVFQLSLRNYALDYALIWIGQSAMEMNLYQWNKAHTLWIVHLHEWQFQYVILVAMQKILIILFSSEEEWGTTILI